MGFQLTDPLPAGAQITRFMGYWRPLSNFYPVDLWVNGVLYPTVEHAFQAAKLDPCNSQRSALIAQIVKAPPGTAKAWGRRVPLRPDWEEVKLDTMLSLLKQKFSTEHPELRTRLLETGQAQLFEGNTWGDDFWGVVMGPEGWRGENHLGRLLMQVREEIHLEIRNVVEQPLGGIDG